MCGIFGYTGILDAKEKLLKGLELLEYRGYDSCGICLDTKKEHQIVKVASRVESLKELCVSLPPSKCGISHTRWATHGKVCKENAHPFKVGLVTLVHNGIIENYLDIKARLIKKGYVFNSSTDSEVLCGLIDSYFDKNIHPCVAIFKAVSELRGAFALGIMFEGYENRIFAVRQKSPLIIARGKDGYYLSSDTYAFLPYTKEYYELGEGEVCELRQNEVIVYNHDGIITPTWKIKDTEIELTEKGKFDTFMKKEIHEQPLAISKTIEMRIENGLPSFSSDKIDNDFFKGISEIHIVGCGSAMHAGLLGTLFLEKYAHIKARCFIASEYRYSSIQSSGQTLLIAISQSGETADTLACVSYAKGSGYKTLAVVNTRDSQIARMCDRVIYTYAGIERAVATTKGYTTQVAILYILSIFLALLRGKIDTESAKKLISSLQACPKAIEKAIIKEKEIESLSQSLSNQKSVFFIGRGLDYPLCLEGALKLKEISYIHAEAYPSGEMKHGTISLIENGTAVISSICDHRLFDKAESNIREVKSRGAYTVAIAKDGEFDKLFKLEGSSIIEDIFFTATIFQLLAYHSARIKGNDVDKPRNLAKSVTVE
ncbi:MAG: glutamine--fructose-6-phosphate transaminase (isomerizing) [Clostridia bacterium]|nr:glutamine--fructose-6-phosphate transaminase (isomerizing) [Clostridia bacterium]